MTINIGWTEKALPILKVPSQSWTIIWSEGTRKMFCNFRGFLKKADF
jgi:hypothetical protein